jgi:hypothetical protein
MDVRELAVRGRQEAWKRLERSQGGPPAWPSLIECLVGSRASLDTALARTRGAWESEASPRFFEGVASDSTSSLVGDRLPAWRERVIAQAEALCRGRFDLLGYRELSFGEPIDWQLDPVSGRRSPLVHWSRLDPLDATRAGDSKVVWELNRHQWLAQLGHAYRLTGNERYAGVCARHIDDWMRANPPGLGINWASSLEVAFRLVAWCWVLALFKGSLTFTTELRARMLAAIATHARHVERHLSSYFSPNTHLTGEALGLFYAGVLFPELRRSQRWQALGTRILVDESQRQVLPDGVYFEQSTCYQRYSVEIYLHFLILARRNGLAIPSFVEERVQRMLDFLLAIHRPDGSLPQIGDADGGWLLPLVPRSPDDARGIFSTAAAFFGSPELAWGAAEMAPESLWLLGRSGLSAFTALRPAPPQAASRVFAAGGYVVMRSGFDAQAHQLIFDAGPLGCPISGGHGHADLLSVQCSAFGEPFLVDPGTYAYTGDPEWRDFFRGTTTHSTAVVDGEGQAMPSGPFSWRARPEATLRRVSTPGGVLLAEADHAAYGRPHDPVLHRRRVLFVEKRYWVLVDDLEGTAEHRVDVQFQFAPIEVAVEPSLWVRARGRKGHGLLVRTLAAVPLKVGCWKGHLAPPRGWLSSAYGSREPAPLIVCSAVTTLPVRIVSLLLPVHDPATAPPPAALTLDAHGIPIELVLGDDSERIRLC